VGGQAVTCPDDGNVCTTNTCEPATGCVAKPAPSGTVCRADKGACDEAEFCSGTTCPADTFTQAGTVCRPASGQCDVAETCTGTTAYCPVNGYKANGTSCDDGQFCTGPNNSDTCNQGVCSGPANTCSDGNACTSDVCNEDANRCEQPPDPSASCEGKMTCGGQILGKADKRSFGGNAQGRAQTPPGAAGGAKGHFNYVNHTSGLKINGPVTFIHYALRTATGGEMRFEVTTKEGCKYNVTVRDNSEPGHKPPHDFLKVEYVSGSCPVENTGDQPLTSGNNQWHDR
jgi:hypothetical protein